MRRCRTTLASDVVEKCFRGFDHFYETLADNGLKEWAKGFDQRASLPCETTCSNLLEVCLLPLPSPPLPSMCTHVGFLF